MHRLAKNGRWLDSTMLQPRQAAVTNPFCPWPPFTKIPGNTKTGSIAQRCGSMRRRHAQSAMKPVASHAAKATEYGSKAKGRQRKRKVGG